jgi:glycerate 2-kinase
VHILICPDKFKGSATAAEVAEAIALGLREALGSLPSITFTLRPLADGGDGTLAVLASRPGATLFSEVVTGPLGEPVTAQWAMLADGTAVVEMAQASGLALVKGPLQACAATTYGTGELIRKAAESGARSCIVGVGGSATTDGGLGALDALGWSLHGMNVSVATDVTTLFVDAAAVFGPQKGADADDVMFLINRLEQLADRYVHELSVDVRGIPRSGAAGGLAGGLLALGATLVSGFDLVADVVGLDAELEAASVVITGEGRADDTSFVGKPVGGVLERAHALNGRIARPLPVYIACGVNALPERSPSQIGIDSVADIFQLVDFAGSVEAAIADPLPYLRDVGRAIGAQLNAQLQSLSK